MDTAKLLAIKINEIIDIARFAPSVHNSQPWHVKIDEDKIEVSIDADHRLIDGDPTGRQTIISLGIFAEAIIIGAKSNNFNVNKIWFQDNKAYIQLTWSTYKIKDQLLLRELKTRCSDRSIYSPYHIGQDIENTLIQSVGKLNAKIWILTEQEQIEKVADLTAKGIGVALSNPRFRLELSRYLILPWSRKRRGIATSSLYIPTLLSISEPLFIRLGVGLKSEVNLERKRWQSSSAIILITTPGDVQQHWFEAGRAYLRLSLTIENLGLSQATSAATVEASNYHEDVEGLVPTSQRLQSVLRIGKGVNNRLRSPRLTVKELIT